MVPHAVQVEDIGKEYLLGLREKSRQTFREAVIDLATAPLRRLRHLSGDAREGRFWALRNISFDVREGEVLGIIGHNGAGKSTLLKILSRITEPTEGRATVRGRVASLLEVGTGFHPELSGRENVYLNGAILGMSRNEIERKFDEIIDFAGVEQFLDTPIKRYSSGMKVRLAFAVAAHLDPEVLIIDEVLAVGDQAFQNKCLGKMNDVATSGRTVLFVSHNMAAVEALCSRVIVLRSGSLEIDDTAAEGIAEYLRTRSNESEGDDVDLSRHPSRSTDPSSAVMQRLRIRDMDAHQTSIVPVGGSIQFHLEVDTAVDIENPAICISLFDAIGSRVTTFHTDIQAREVETIRGRVTILCTFENCRLAPGVYSVMTYVASNGNLVDKIDHATSLEVCPRDLYGTGKSMPRKGGVYIPEVTWGFTAAAYSSDVELVDRS